MSRYLFSGAIAGVMAGVIFLGLGSRIVMRIVALLNPDVDGAITGAEAVVGDITFVRTASLVILGGLLSGILVATLWVIVREWLPARIWPRIFLTGFVAVLVGSFASLEAENSDFVLFESTTLIIVMFMLLAALAGFSTACGDHLLLRRLPRSAKASTVYGVLIAIGASFGPIMLVMYFFVSGFAVAEPPRLVGVFVLCTATATLLRWIRYMPTDYQFPKGMPWVRALGVTGILGMSISGAFHLGGQPDRIYS